MSIEDDLKAEMRAKLLGSFILFEQYFFPKVTGREFKISQPIGRESHFITMARELTAVARLETLSLNINVPPGSGKSVTVAMWVAWTMARYPHSQYIYVSYAKSLAAKHTEFIKRIVSLPIYQELFGIYIRHDTRAKEYFANNFGGAVRAFGSAGSITGQDAGLPNQDCFSGAAVLDDLHKPDEAHSDTMRQAVIDNYTETILPRPRGPNVPIIHIGQRVHEKDIVAHMLSGNDEREWKSVILKAIDDAGNALYPEVNPLEQLLIKKEKSKYVFSAQYQQEPVPAGDALFNRSMFPLLDEEPEILMTFITVDTAETAKSYNDASAFSFWGIYKLKNMGQETGQIALHWLNCWERRVEPKDLEPLFLDFYADCMLHPVKPLIALIERKSTGVTLASILSEMRGLQIRNVERTAASGSKAARYVEMQPILAAKLVSLPSGAKHVETCLSHMEKITANDTHAHDDICFAAGTKIATATGSKPIEDVRVGEFVLTPFGLRKVLASGLTGYAETIDKMGLKGTPNHKVFYSDSFERLDNLHDAVKINLLSLKGLMRWKYKKLLYLMESNIDLWARKDIILANQQIIKEEKILKDCMLRFGNFITTKQYLKSMLFTTRMATVLITTLTIWSVFQLSNICRNIADLRKPFAIPKLAKSISRKLDLLLCNGTEVQKDGYGIVRILKNTTKKFFTKEKGFVLFVKNLLKPEKMLQPAAAIVIQQNIEETSGLLMHSALYAMPALPLKSIIQPAKIEEHVQNHAPAKLEAVYNLTVDKINVYYANGILVSNCDTAYDAVKSVLIDKTLYRAQANTQAADNLMRNLAARMQRQQHLRRQR